MIIFSSLYEYSTLSSSAHHLRLLLSLPSHPSRPNKTHSIPWTLFPKTSLNPLYVRGLLYPDPPPMIERIAGAGNGGSGTVGGRGGDVGSYNTFTAAGVIISTTNNNYPPPAP